MSAPFTLAARLRSVRYAVNGVWLVLKTQHNAWIHAVATVAAACAGFALNISKTDWCLLILACAAVWTAEALNTALEYLADATLKKFDPLIGQAKDVAAGAVLITAIAAATVGLLVFYPYILPQVASAP
jgi:diacylglycerol kinase (ATP)